MPESRSFICLRKNHKPVAFVNVLVSCSTSVYIYIYMQIYQEKKYIYIYTYMHLHIIHYIYNSKPVAKIYIELSVETRSSAQKYFEASKINFCVQLQ